jgi:ankyrin repeat protein
MKRIESQAADSKELAKQALSWIICAKRPLTTSELQHALAVEVGDSELDKENLPQVEDMVSVCAGLVTVDDESRIIRLVHYTTQEYFDRTQSHWFPNTETNITTICVTYLSFDVFKDGFCETDEEFEERLRSNQFFAYAAQNWGHHTRKASTLSQALSQTVIDFLQSEGKVRASSQGLLATKRYLSHSNYSQEVPRRITGLHLTAYFGVEYVVNLLLETVRVEADSKDGIDGRTPLSWAAESGHAAVVKLLLDTGKVEADSKNNWGRTPLWFAAGSGHINIVQLLLDTGKAEADSKDRWGQTPLSTAADSGHVAIVQLLLNTGKVEVDSKDKENDRTPLWFAAASGHAAIVKLLLDTGKVEADLKDREDGRTPLSRAAGNGHAAVVKLLLDISKVETDSKDKRGQTPLWWARENQRENVIKLFNPLI